jgi:hypothetical protein
MRGELELTIKDPLDFDYHLNRYKQALANEETKAGGMICALTDYQMSVRSGLSKFTGQALATANKLKNKKAQQYLTYGVGRRLRMMLVSYCGIFDTIAPDRKEPLPLNDMAAVSRDLNIIYINIRGTLDNYAWCIYHERGMELKESQVGLFYKEFRNDANLKMLRRYSTHTMIGTPILSLVVTLQRIACPCTCRPRS